MESNNKCFNDPTRVTGGVQLDSLRYLYGENGRHMRAMKGLHGENCPVCVKPSDILISPCSLEGASAFLGNRVQRGKGCNGSGDFTTACYHGLC